MEDIYKNANSALEATEIAKYNGVNRSGIEILKELITKRRVFGPDWLNIDDETKSKIKDKLIKEIKEKRKKVIIDVSG